MLFKFIFSICLSVSLLTPSCFGLSPYEELIQLYNEKIKKTDEREIQGLNNLITALLAGGRELSAKPATDIQRANMAYIAIHVAYSSQDTIEGNVGKLLANHNRFLSPLASETKLNHFRNLLVIYLATMIKRDPSNESSDLASLIIYELKKSNLCQAFIPA